MTCGFDAVAPSSLVTVNVTVYVCCNANECEVVRPVAVCPSPKFQEYCVTLGEFAGHAPLLFTGPPQLADASNCTGEFADGVAGLKTKEGVGVWRGGRITPGGAKRIVPN